MNHQERLLRRINNEETWAEKFLRTVLLTVMLALGVVTLLMAVSLTVQIIVFEAAIPTVQVGILWWLVGTLLVSIIVWVVAAR